MGEEKAAESKVPVTEHCPEAKAFLEKVNEIVLQMDVAYLKGVKASARRARVALAALKKEITPMREKLLESMKSAKE